MIITSEQTETVIIRERTVVTTGPLKGIGGEDLDPGNYQEDDPDRGQDSDQGGQ